MGFCASNTNAHIATFKRFSRLYETKKKEPYRFKEGANPCIVMVPDSVKVTVRSANGRVEIGTRFITLEGEFFLAQKFLEMLNSK